MNEKLTHDRDSAIKWARNLFAANEFVVFDCETTGLSGKAEILQFAIISGDGQNAIQFDICPSSRASLDEAAFRVHGITLESVQSAPPITMWAQNLHDLIKGKTVITWNAAFDYRMLVQSFKAWNVEPPQIVSVANFECAMLQYAKFHGEWNASRGQYVWQKLPGAAHGSEVDCRAVLTALHEMANAKLSTEPASAEQPLVIVPADEPAAGHDPAANGYTFDMFDVAPPATAAPDSESAPEYHTSLVNLLGMCGMSWITREIVAGWSEAQRIEAIDWAAKTSIANIELALNGLGSFPSRPAFFPRKPGTDPEMPA